MNAPIPSSTNQALPSLPEPDLTTAELLEILGASGKPLKEWGQAIDGTPMLSACTGGHKQPAIFITAGVHSNETAGIHAALNLLKLLDTEHEVHILPLRDPFGFAGVQHCLSFAAGESVQVSNHEEVLDYLQARAELLWQGEQMHLFKLGEVGFVWNVLLPGLDSFWDILTRIGQLAQEEPNRLESLKGKSVMLVNPDTGFEGAGEMRRCWHAVISADGQWVHLNRLFGRRDAPPEVKAVDRLMQTVRPGLTCDLHEGNGHGFWMPIPRPEKEAERVFEMTRTYFDTIRARAYPITDYDDWRATDHTATGSPDWMKPEPRLPGMFWANTLQRGEGHNLSTYACLFGIGFGTEAPLSQPLAMRVDGITHGVLAAIKVWEETQ
jgi:hypothetical protein